MSYIYLRQKDKDLSQIYLVADQYLYVYVQKKSLKGYTKRFNIISGLQAYTKMVTISLEERINVILYFPLFAYLLLCKTEVIKLWLVGQI